MRVHHSTERNGFTLSYVNEKIAFSHLSVRLIGQGDWKSHSRPGFDSWQFAAQAEKCRWAEKCHLAENEIL